MGNAHNTGCRQFTVSPKSITVLFGCSWCDPPHYHTLVLDVNSKVSFSHFSWSNEWIGVDFDKTLATEVEFTGPDSLGDPIEPMVDRVKQWLADGEDVRIFTGRVGPHPSYYKDGRPIDPDFARKARAAIEAWCLRVFGRVLPITNQKDFGMKALYDDKAVQVEPNTGRIIGDCYVESPRLLLDSVSAHVLVGSRKHRR